MLPLSSITESLLKLKTYLFYNNHSCLSRLFSRNGNFSIQIRALSTKLNLKRSLYSKNIPLVRSSSSPCGNDVSSLLSCMAFLKFLISLFLQIMVSMCWERKRERKNPFSVFVHHWLGSQPSNLIFFSLNSLTENGSRENMFNSMRYV